MRFIVCFGVAAQLAAAAFFVRLHGRSQTPWRRTPAEVNWETLIAVVIECDRCGAARSSFF